MRVALVRGPQLNPFEMQTFTPLASRGFELTAFTSGRAFFEAPAGMSIVKLSSPMDAIVASSGLARKAREAFAYKRGTANRLDGLVDALEGFDIIHSAETFNAYTAQAADAAARYERPLVVTVWENIPFLPIEPAFERNRERVLQEAAAFIAITERARAALLLEGAPAERIHVVPVGIDLERFAPGAADPAMRERLGIPPHALTFLFIARVTWEKGILDIIHALKMAELRGGAAADAHLVVVGSGDLEAVVRDRVKRLGLEARIHLVGAVPYEDTARYYRMADAFVLGSIPQPRWQEQYGMVLVEAMASGLPVITAASGSIPEVVGDAGILVQANDATAMVDAMEQMADPDLRARLAKEGRRRVEDRYERNEVARRIEAIYRAL